MKSVEFTRFEFVGVSEALSGAPTIQRRSEAGDEDSGDGACGGGDGIPGTGGATGGGGGGGGVGVCGGRRVGNAP